MLLRKRVHPLGEKVVCFSTEGRHKNNRHFLESQSISGCFFVICIIILVNSIK